MLHQNENLCIAVLLLSSFVLLSSSYKVKDQNAIGRGSEYTRSSSNVPANVGEVIAPRAPVISSHEPSCEELRAMWRFSKRQSRASEITNEIPAYRDPFAFNVWDMYYPTTRSMGGMRMNSRYRGDPSRVVYGMVRHLEPSYARFRDSLARERAFDEVPRIYTPDSRLPVDMMQPRRRVQFRFAGSGGSNQQNVLTPQRGSFQRLKELIWTERAKELAQQRKSEELAARAAVLKELTNGQGYAGYNEQQGQEEVMDEMNDDYDTESRTAVDSSEILPFPDMLAPTNSRMNVGNNNNMMEMQPKFRNSKYSPEKKLLLPAQSQMSDPGSFIGGGIQPQPQSHFRERNRAASRHGGY